MRLRIACVLGLFFFVASVSAQSTAQNAGLRIVVIEGEDAVNVIQQKSAVAPLIEVRDRNDQPVAGAMVRFAISKGRASFSGARALTVTTNTAGRAIATGFSPTGSGALQISAAATFQGQTAVVTIAQTNVMTAAAAGTGAGTVGAGGGAGAGGAGAGQEQGTKDNITFHGSHGGLTPDVTANYDFAGALSGATITGTFTLDINSNCCRTLGTFPVTLQKQ